MPYQSHSSAIIDHGARIGEGSRIWHWVHVCSGAKIGQGCSLGQNVFVGNRVIIGDNVKIQNNVSVYDGVTLENDVFCGPSVVFTNVYNPRAEIRKMDQLRPTRVCRGATIGANATVVCGVTIGCYAFIGAGAVVTRDVPDHALVFGNPARNVGWMCRCGERLTNDLLCPVCGDHYEMAGNGIRIRETAP